MKTKKKKEEGIHSETERYLRPKSLLSVLLLQFYDQQQYVCATICLVRSIFMRVRSLWNLCARAHVHSLEGTLTFNFLPLNWTKLDSRKVVYTFIHRKRKLKVYQTKKCKNQNKNTAAMESSFWKQPFLIGMKAMISFKHILVIT